MTISRKRVLVVEDELLIALHLKDILTEIGFDAELADNLKDGVQFAQSETFDAALLDINLEGKPSFEIADVLLARGVPMVFITGYRAGGLNSKYQHIQIVEKPFDPETLAEQVRSLTA